MAPPTPVPMRAPGGEICAQYRARRRSREQEVSADVDFRLPRSSCQWRQSPGRTFMGTKGEAFAGQFEAKVEEATALLEKLTDADWKKTTAAEKWTVAVTAHHIASSYESATHIITTIAAGQELPHFNREMLDDVNAQHAKEFAGCTKAETIA